ncbi:hypothetical protein N9D01_03560 [Cyclobacteriaceae bacterium]|jgi:hypothetical protein|nr:hypothetical protein [Cyclobacteriaceae bacterium]MDA9906399.1 hypothetical protein [Cyclobacteriaceae bacterium]
MKIFAREFLWFITAIILALPVAYLFIEYMSLTPAGNQSTIQEQTFEMELFITGGIIGIIFTYIMRLVIWAITKIIIEE